MHERPARPEQLRGAIDAGQTAGKVAFPDPAAVPLGADDEAAGTPPPEPAVRLAMKGEIRQPRQPQSEGSEPPFWPGALYVIIGSLSLAALIGWLLL
ncbi:hypothetical protein ACFPFW_08330 [Flaviflagellibacter deserti]|uniref:Uncharacterized protein n=2 Tax=Flaviflagellibacter deserti TaxID=2267266 RepID=A0ABV9Z2H2_9HYPH